MEATTTNNMNYRPEDIQKAIDTNDMKFFREFLSSGREINEIYLKDEKNIYQYIIDRKRWDVLGLFCLADTDFDQADTQGNTPLIYACMKDAFPAVEILIYSDVDCNKINKDNKNAFYYAFSQSNWGIVFLLLENNVNIHALGDEYADPLQYLAQQEQNLLLPTTEHENNSQSRTQFYLFLVEALIRSGSEINIEDHLGKTPLQLACMKENTDLAKVFMYYWAHVNHQDHNRTTPLMELAKGKSEERAELIKELVQQGADPFIRDKNRKTATDFAKESNNTKALEVLEDAKKGNIAVNPNPKRASIKYGKEDRNKFWTRANDLAQEWEHTAKIDKEPSFINDMDTFEFTESIPTEAELNSKDNNKLKDTGNIKDIDDSLLQKTGRIINLDDKEGNKKRPKGTLSKNVQKIIELFGQERPGPTFLNTLEKKLAIDDKDTDDLKNNRLGNPNARNAKGVPLASCFASKGKLTELKLLAKLRADLDIKDFTGRTPLIYACIYGREFIVDFLIQQGVNLEILDQQGYRAMIYAVQQNHLEIVKNLITNNASFNFKLHGQNLLMRAVAYKSFPMCKLLFNAGIDPKEKGSKSVSALDLAHEMELAEIMDLFDPQ